VTATTLPGGDEIPLIHERRRRRRPVLWLSAAAVAAGVVVAAGILISGGHSGGQSAAPVPLPTTQFTLPFTVDPSADVQLVGALAADPYEQYVELADTTHHLVLIVDTSGVTDYDGTGLQQVDINGATGYYGVGATGSQKQWGRRQELTSQFEATLALPTPACGPGSCGNVSYGQGERHLVWHVTSPLLPRGAYLELTTAGLPMPGNAMPEAEFLAAARALDFTQTSVIRIPFSLAHAPAGTVLVGGGSSYYGREETVDEGDHLAPNWVPVAGGADWDADMSYAPPAGGVLDIDVTSVDRSQDHSHPVQVGPSSGYWEPSAGRLTVKLRDGVYVTVQAIMGVKPDSSVTETNLASVVSLVTVIDNPSDRSTWLNAADALPIG
jgi:hypothetical protein